jgi:hypothetical protein
MLCSEHDRVKPDIVVLGKGACRWRVYLVTVVWLQWLRACPTSLAVHPSLSLSRRLALSLPRMYVSALNPASAVCSLCVLCRLCCAALSGGILPVSAVMTSDEIMLTIKPGQHGVCTRPGLCASPPVRVLTPAAVS